MELPDPIKAIAAQLEAGGEVAPPPELFEAYDVFAAELAGLFVRPWLALDHASRLTADGDYFRADLGPRSVVMVRESESEIHALRNACLHAGYRVCEDEAGHADKLFCIYHGWYYALDGRLTDPMLRPEEPDRSRYRLPRYAMQIDRGLILVDMSKAAPSPPEADAPDLREVPNWLADATVTGRQRCNTSFNWKYLRQLLWSAPDLVFEAGGCDKVIEFGPMSFLALRGNEAALVRLSPRYPGQSDFDVIRMAPNGTSATGSNERLAEALRQRGEAVAGGPLKLLERDFYDWYWSALSAPAAA
ncbi:MAG TPA: Rieske (2Fe-2S) protein [Stellaceae bacterium]|jgi:nitrite reductase/ring-hydroxylating ferredoxin subunit|nr:Rieske (2Fe-2S) protein [Stellaceae bacterium]